MQVDDLKEPFIIAHPVSQDKTGGYLFSFNFAGDMQVLADFFSDRMQDNQGLLYFFQTANKLYNIKQAAKKRKRTVKAKKEVQTQLELF